MNIKDLSKLESLEKRLSELESQKKKNLLAFGRSYSQVGSSDSDFLIKTKGQVKIQWGAKFIDLIKEGKINVESEFIFTAESQDTLGVKDGIYIINDGSVYLKTGDTVINLVGEAGTTYVSFLAKQKTLAEQKHTALQNIGFIYDNLSSLTETSLQNGIIYIESEKKLYIVDNGNASEFTVSFPNPFTKQFIISKNDEDKGAMLIKGSGINNSLAFDSMLIYTDSRNSYLDSEGNIYIRVGQEEKVVIGNSLASFNIPVSSNIFQSKAADTQSGFRLYISGGESTLEVDNLIVRNASKDALITLHPTCWYGESNVIKSAIPFQNPENPNEQSFEVSLLYKNNFMVGDSLYVYSIIEKENYSVLGLIPLTIIRLDTEAENIIYAKIEKSLASQDILESSQEDILSNLMGEIVFLVGRSDSNPVTILKTSKENLDIVQDSQNFDDEKDISKIASRVGNLTELGISESEKGELKSIEGYGMFSKKGYFTQLGYTDNYTLPDEDDSSKSASTEWVRKLINRLIPKGTIIAYHGEGIPDCWALCDGNNGTPDLRDKFIKAGTVEEEGSRDEILLQPSNIPVMNVSSSVTANAEIYSGKKIPALDTVEEYVFGEGGSSHYCIYTGKDKGGNGLTSIAVDNLGSLLSLSGSIGALPESQTPIKIEPKYYSLIFIMKIK